MRGCVQRKFFHAHCRMAATQATACPCAWPGLLALPTGAAWSCRASQKGLPHHSLQRMLQHPQMWSLQTPAQSRPLELLRPQTCCASTPTRSGKLLASALRLWFQQRSLPSRRLLTSQPQTRRLQAPQQTKEWAWRSVDPQTSCPQSSLTSNLPLGWPPKMRCGPCLPYSVHFPLHLRNTSLCHGQHSVL